MTEEQDTAMTEEQDAAMTEEQNCSSFIDQLGIGGAPQQQRFIGGRLSGRSRIGFDTDGLVISEEAAKKSPLLADVARSPERLAEALLGLLETQSVVEMLLRGALDHLLSSGDSDSAAAGPDRSSQPTLRRLDSYRDDTAASSVMEDEDISREQLQIIKARTMYNMVEEVDDGKCKLLFLTNPQADLIASSPESVQKMLDALEIPKPSLVIELIKSWGLGGSTRILAPELYAAERWCAGLKHDNASFLSREEESAAEARIDMFMADVIIPLAAQTNAVVLCNAVPDDCILSTSFTRMYSVARAKWHGPPPFTVISSTNALGFFYRNDDESAHWRNVRRSSRSWRQRDPKCFEVHGPKSGDPTGAHDLDANASCIILTDCINPKRDQIDAKPFASLMGALVAHLSSSVPSIALRTGFSCKDNLGDSSAMHLNMVNSRAQSGTPVLALDIRPRTELLEDSGRVSQTRGDVVAAAQRQIDASCDALLGSGLAETFDVCTLAFLHKALTGDGDVLASKSVGGHASTSGAAVPLHEAIRRAREDEGGTVEEGDLPRASPTQIADVAEWLSNRIFGDAWRLLDDVAEREARGETYHTLYHQEMYSQTTYSRMLLASPNFYNLNLTDTDGAQRIVNQLVRLDRLPACNSLEGLLLLRSAWREHDVAMLLAAHYKTMCKAIFALQLALSWLVVVGSALDGHPALAFSVAFSGSIVHAVFGVSVAFSILVSLDSMLNPKARWRQLRSGAGALRSAVWQYRTRTGPFELDESRRDSTRPELMLCAMLNEWRDDLMAGAGLKTTNLQKEYPAHVYQHFQDKGAPKGAGADDDHHSPTQPARYIELRIEPMMAFYTYRIPGYNRHSLMLKVCVLGLGVVSSVLARYEELTLVTAVTAAATITTSWSEFSDAAHKVERYSTAVGALKKLLSWWDSLGEVQKASRDSISHLVGTAEAIISEEQTSWTSILSKQGGRVRGEKGEVPEVDLATSA